MLWPLRVVAVSRVYMLSPVEITRESASGKAASGRDYQRIGKGHKGWWGGNSGNCTMLAF